MKNILISAITLSACTVTSVLAAERPSSQMAPVMAAPSVWTGFYAGLNTGAVFGGNNTVSTSAFPSNDTSGIAPNLMLNSAALAAGSTVVNNAGFVGGGQIGYNWQFGDRLVSGIETDIQGVAGATGTSTRYTAAPLPGTPIGNLTSVLATSKSLNYIGTFRGRLGYLFNANLLIYGTGGLAYGGVRSNTSIYQVGLDDLPPPPVVPLDPISSYSAGSLSQTQVGWTAGGGGEWMFRDNWSIKAEYLYYDLGRANYNLSPLTVFNHTKGAFTATSLASSSTRFNGNIIRAGVNYHFNISSAPLIPK